MDTLQIKLYNILRKQMNVKEETAQEFVQVIDTFIENEINKNRTEAATKDFVDKKVTEAKNDMIKWFVGLFITLALIIIGLYFK